MAANKIIKEQLRQTEIMTLLSEKRTILSELRTWITMVLLPISIITAALAIIKYNPFINTNIFNIIIIFSIVFICAIIYFIMKNTKDLFKLNRKIHGIELP